MSSEYRLRPSSEGASESVIGEVKTAAAYDSHFSLQYLPLRDSLEGFTGQTPK